MWAPRGFRQAVAAGWVRAGGLDLRLPRRGPPEAPTVTWRRRMSPAARAGRGGRGRAADASRTPRVAVAVLVIGLLAACGAAGDGGTPPPGRPPLPPGPRSRAARPHRRATAATTGTAAAPAPLRAGERFATLRLPGGATVGGAGRGPRRLPHCFLIDPHLAASRAPSSAPTSSPGRPGLVHHAILFRVPPGGVAAARARRRWNPGRGWTCFGDTGLRPGRRRG